MDSLLFAADFGNGIPSYLNEVITAWRNVISGFGQSGMVADYIRNAYNTGNPQLINAVSSLGYNYSAINLYEIKNHLDSAFSAIDMPLKARRDECFYKRPNCMNEKKYLIVDGDFSTLFGNYDSHQNGNFENRTNTAIIKALGYFTDGAAFGIGYTHSDMNTRNTPADIDAIGNSVTLFMKYLGHKGFFVDFGLNGGHARWESKNNPAGFRNSNVYDMNFYAGQIYSGLVRNLGHFSLLGQIGGRYSYMKSEKYTDAFDQSFKKWWYNTLTGFGNIILGYNFTGQNFIVMPMLKVGGSYDVITRGTDTIGVNVISGDGYTIPVEAPKRAAFSGGLGIDFYVYSIMLGAEYKLETRSNYTLQIAELKFKVAF